MHATATAAPAVYLKSADVAARLNISLRRAQDIIARGELASISISGARRVRPADLAAYEEILADYEEILADCLKAPDVAARLNISLRHAHYLVARGELVGVRIGGTLCVRPADLAAYEAKIFAEAKAEARCREQAAATA